jgi:LPS O-antigen subunit length determinant protein (WzzB/FepE family)
MNDHQEFKSDEIDITALIQELIDKKAKIAIVTSIFALIAVVYSLFLPNNFSSFAVVKGASNSNDQMSSSVSGLARIAGLPLSMQSDDTIYLIEVLKSFDLFKENLDRNSSHKKKLAAIDYYDKSSEKIVYMSEIYDSKQNIWRKEEPSFQEIYRSIIVPNLEVKQKLRSASLIEIKFTHQSPFFAKEYVTSLIETLNESSKNKDLQETEKSIMYLQETFQNTSQSQVRNSISDLLTNQLKKRMYANSRTDYLIEIIEYPFVPELKSSPRRSIIVLNYTLVGFLLSLLYFLTQFFRNTYFK